MIKKSKDSKDIININYNFVILHSMFAFNSSNENMYYDVLDNEDIVDDAYFDKTVLTSCCT